MTDMGKHVIGVLTNENNQYGSIQLHWLRFLWIYYSHSLLAFQ